MSIGTNGPSTSDVFGASRPAPLAWRPVLAVLTVAGTVHLAVATRFGWHRDEFYYVISGRHPAWGYPDQPPLTPLLARLAADLPGGVLPLRLLAIAAQLGCILLVAVLAAEFGGRARAQTIAAAALAACPVFVAAALLFGTTVNDQLAWAAVFVTVTRALRLGTVRAWRLAGAIAGIGLENKGTIAVMLLGVTVGVVLFHRAALRTAGPWLAGALAVLIAAPNVVWNAQHNWAQFRMGSVLSDRVGGPLGALADLPLLALVYAGLPLIMLWVFGLRWLGSAAGRQHRWVLVVAVTAVVVFTASGGKAYYPAPVLIGLFAAGGVWLEARTAQARTVQARTPAEGRLRRWRWPAAITASAVFALLVGLPSMPPRAYNVLSSVDPEPMDTYGWPAFVRQVAAVADTMPPDASIFTSNYGEAGALTILGPSAGLRLPVSSGHNGYQLWGPPPGTTPDTVLCVGEFDASYLRRSWSEVHLIAPITMPGGIVNEEVAQHAAIYLCRQPYGDWAQIWPGLHHLD